MSQFASGQGSQIQALGALARTAGEGKKFLTRFEMEQKALGTALRAQQQQQQAADAEADRGVQLQRLAAEQQSRRFSQALQAQQQQEQAQQDSVNNEINTRKLELQQARELRDLEKQEQDLVNTGRSLDIREADLEITRDRELRLGKQGGNQVVTDLTRTRGTALQNIRKARQVLDDPLGEVDPQTRQQLESAISQESATLADTDRQLTQIALVRVQESRVNERRKPVSINEASPETRSALSFFGQAETENLPQDPSLDTLEPGVVYFIPGREPSLFDPTTQQFIETSRFNPDSFLRADNFEPRFPGDTGRPQ